MPAARRPARTVDAYIAAQPSGVRALLDLMRATIRKAAPDAEEAMKYGIPTFVLGENLVHFAAARRHIGFYPTPSAITAFAKELSRYRSSKGAVQFPLDQRLPLGLVGRIVRFRVKEARARAAGGKGVPRSSRMSSAAPSRSTTRRIARRRPRGH
jgi:uncharacterized protein YdhG (YjbR/CyaY superfamily)